ncbi:MAG: hypothetical protein ACP5T3_02140, partial [Candidatus Micrarchaeia archaeon]
MAKKLRTLHKNRRRSQASSYLKGVLAQKLKLEPEQVKLSSALNRRIVAYMIQKPRRLKVSVEVKEGKATASLYTEPGQQGAQKVEQKPVQKPAQKEQQHASASAKASSAKAS